MLYKFLQFLNESDFNKIIFTTDILYRIDLCTAILKLQESGVIGELQNKWWKEKRGGNMCDISILTLYSCCIMARII